MNALCNRPSGQKDWLLRKKPSRTPKESERLEDEGGLGRSDSRRGKSNNSNSSSKSVQEHSARRYQTHLLVVESRWPVSDPGTAGGEYPCPAIGSSGCRAFLHAASPITCGSQSPPGDALFRPPPATRSWSGAYSTLFICTFPAMRAGPPRRGMPSFLFLLLLLFSFSSSSFLHRCAR